MCLAEIGKKVKNVTNRLGDGGGKLSELKSTKITHLVNGGTGMKYLIYNLGREGDSRKYVNLTPVWLLKLLQRGPTTFHFSGEGNHASVV